MSSGEIDLRVYYTILKKRLWFILTCVIVTTSAAAVYSNYNYQPLYQASTKLLVNKTVELDQLGKEQMDFGAIGVNISLINTYKEIIKTPVIMEKVVQRNPDLNLNADQLINTVNVYAVNDTQVMAITVIDYSYERAVFITNAVAEVFQAEIPKILKVDNVTILTEAKMKDFPQPINERTNTYIILGFMASLIFSVGVVLLLESLDDTLKSEEDIRQVLAVPSLTVVPKMNARQIKATSRHPSRKGAMDPYVSVKS